MFKPTQCSEEIAAIIRNKAAQYSLPRWFIFAVCQTESSFDPESRNTQDEYAATPYFGSGLTQLSGAHYVGIPWPFDLQAPDNSNRNWRDDMGLSLATSKPYFKDWIDMQNVSRLDDRFDPAQNLDRWATGYAVPAYYMVAKRYRLTDPNAIFMRVALHWKTGVFKEFDPAHIYLTNQYGYDRWVREFRGPCEAEDGPYTGTPHYGVPLPPPVPAGVSQAVYDAEVARRVEAEARIAAIKVILQ